MALFINFTKYDLYSVFFTQYLYILLLVVIVSRYLQFRWERRHLDKLAGILDGPKGLPILGNSLFFWASPTDMLTKARELMNQFRSPGKFCIGPYLVVYILEPEQIKTVLANTSEKGYAYKFIQKALKTGLLSAPVSIWKRHRKIIQPTFSQKVLDTYINVFNEQSAILIKILEEVAHGNYFDVYPYLNNCTLDAICENALGVKMNSQFTGSKFNYCMRVVLDCIFQRTTKVWLAPDLIFNLTPMGKEYHRCVGFIKSLCLKVLTEQRENYKKEEFSANVNKSENEFDQHMLKRKSFSQLLIESTNMNDDELFDEVVTITMTGTDSISTTTGFCLMALGMYPEYQDKVYQEIYGIYQDSNRPVSLSDLPRLTYLEMFIKETMRVFTIIPFIARDVTKDFRVDDYVLPKGCHVVLGLVQVHNDPKIWPNPKQFDPDRFLPENCAKRHPYSFLPFSNGPRNCIGLNYANMFMKILLVHILRKYRISSDMKLEDVRLHVEISLKATDGFKIKLHKR